MIYRDCDIGHTPCFEVSKGIYAKLEYFNRSGSIKDRPVYNILMTAQVSGAITPGISTLVEATSGNTGIAIAQLGKQMGYKVIIVMPCNMSIERQNIIKDLGAELMLCSEGNFAEAIQIRDEICKNKDNHYNVNQFHNPHNIEAHFHGTGSEIAEFLTTNNIVPSAFICGTGTGGTFMGIYKKLKPLYPSCKFSVVEPAESPVMSGGSPGLHGIQGIGDGSKFLVDLQCVDDIILVSTDEATTMAMEINNDSKFNLPIGISSGANYLGALKMQNKYGGSVVTIFSDHANRYQSIFQAKI